MIHRELQDYFDALEYWRRVTVFTIETDELLRRGTTRTNRKRQESLLRSAREQLSAQMKARNRHMFRADVAVDISFHAVGVDVVPSTQHVIKRYLDAMTDIVYADDRQIAHLVVHRFADAPRQHDRIADEHVQGLSESDEDGRPRAYVFVWPVRVLAHDWDRIFRHDSRSWRYADSRSEALESGWHELIDDQKRSMQDDRLHDLLDEARADRHGRSSLRFLPTDVADLIRRMDQEQLKELQLKQILDQLPGQKDRPNGTATRPDTEALQDPKLDESEFPERYEFPGQFWLPLNANEHDWKKSIRAAMECHRSHWNVLAAQFRGSLALDIGAFGTTPPAKDIDNLAHTVLSEFESLYCGERAGTVVMYRAYRRPSDQPGVRVLVMDPERLQLLLDMVDGAREEVIEHGFDRYEH